MLLGTGNYNYAAVNACGINQEEALSHLKTALALNPTIKPAQDALAFCQKEIAEIKTWRNALRVSGEDDTTYSNYQVKETKSGSKNKDTVSLLLQNNAVACMLQKLRLFVLQKVLYLFQWLNLCKINSTMCDSISTKIAKEFVTPGSERGAKIEAMLKVRNKYLFLY